MEQHNALIQKRIGDGENIIHNEESDVRLRKTTAMFRRT